LPKLKFVPGGKTKEILISMEPFVTEFVPQVVDEAEAKPSASAHTVLSRIMASASFRDRAVRLVSPQGDFVILMSMSFA
jgi:hypothetical protein